VKNFLKFSLQNSAIIAVVASIAVISSMSDKTFHPNGGYLPILVAIVIVSLIGGPLSAFLWHFKSMWWRE
jgi:hypothetical protein